jgi:hypothetical protein
VGEIYPSMSLLLLSFPVDTVLAVEQMTPSLNFFGEVCRWRLNGFVTFRIRCGLVKHDVMLCFAEQVCAAVSTSSRQGLQI